MTPIGRVALFAAVSLIGASAAQASMPARVRTHVGCVTPPYFVGQGDGAAAQVRELWEFPPANWKRFAGKTVVFSARRGRGLNQMESQPRVLGDCDRAAVSAALAARRR